ncbi:hypothetical protein A3J61_02565 [Candidatus Nomurabacteria bacterium RIFCSPHIGHO2_02_FULL_38_15]|uniref:Ig-like domain-containing protein n=1 Tax=Candidatus Nomurabacteria bacterium RIFCSPHIGHO2_02_FULL_38_15 TaxID=1801752 RepID=A0A1F6VQ74_9BACT|nr:MAG: hypothetical protein A3J61_02565 [Candidatus Nomurabacteria bacterium RIFCSPHIGHO2_02_FULL_38_15]
MNNNLIKFLKTSFFAVAFVLVFILVGAFGFAQKTSAAVSDHVLHGYIWSDNIGWISLNCEDRGGNVCATSDYKVVINYTTGVLSGHGWSSNIGWVSFNGSDVSDCQFKDYGCQATAVLSNSGAKSAAFPHVVGWARALSHNNAWDGYISLSCYNKGCGASPDNYGVVLPNDGSKTITDNGNITGKAWGSTVTGWLDFQYVTVTKGSSELVLRAFAPDTDPSKQFTTTVISVANVNDKIDLQWYSPTDTAYDSCVGTGAGDANYWDNNQNNSFSTTSPASLQNVGVLNDPTTFQIECFAGAKSDIATVVVDIDYQWGLGMTAKPPYILPGMNSLFEWATTGSVPVGTTCDSGGWALTNEGTQKGESWVNAIMYNISRSYTCTPPPPDDPKTATAEVKVLQIDNYGTDTCFKKSNGGPTISWLSKGAQSCKIIDPNSNETAIGVTGTKLFSGGAGDYKIVCTGGAYSVDQTLTATECAPDYTMVPLNSCNGKAGQETDNAFQPYGGLGQYRALVKVDSVPEQGFSTQLKYKFTAPNGWALNNWTIGGAGWSRIGMTDEYETQFSSNYAATIEILAPSKAAVTNYLNSKPKKTETFVVNGEAFLMSLPHSAGYTICAPDGGNTKPKFIEQ